MNTERIKELAEQEKKWLQQIAYQHGGIGDLASHELEFGAMVAAAEREACAKLCDDRVTAYQYATDVWAQEHIDEARHLAKAIRARGNE